MTKMPILAQRKQRLEKLKNKLAQEENALRIQERKQRTRGLIEKGGLVIKAGLESLDADELYGALLSLKESLHHDTRLKETWAKKGGIAFNKEQQGKTPVIVSFTEKPSEEIRDQIRTLGLKWNAIRKEWQGHVVWEEIQQVLSSQKATLTEVK